MDSCTLIYLIKTKLFSEFMDLLKYPLVIDSSVYQEVIIEGKAKNYPDAIEAEIELNKFKIPVISIDVSPELSLFKDSGETSCFILAKENGVCLTSDDRAYKKFVGQDILVMRIDSFYFEMVNQNLISEEKFIKTLKQLERVNATKPNSIVFFMEKLKQKRDERKND